MAEKTRLVAYTVSEYEKDGAKQSRWLEIGVAFPHKDEEGLDVTLHALPVNGRIVLRKPKPKPEQGGPA